MNISNSIIHKKNLKKTNGAAKKYSANNFNSFTSQMFKNLDIYGHRINLNYKGE